jgi:exopolysaccharide biosynthesis protein
MRKGLKGNVNQLSKLRDWLKEYKNFCNPKVIKYDAKLTKMTSVDKKRELYGISNRIKQDSIKINMKNQIETMAIQTPLKCQSYSINDR